MIYWRSRHLIGLGLALTACSSPTEPPASTEPPEDLHANDRERTERSDASDDVSDDVTASTHEEAGTTSPPLDAGPTDTEPNATEPTSEPDAAGSDVTGSDVTGSDATVAAPLDAGPTDTEPVMGSDASGVTEDCPVEYHAGHGDLFLAYDEAHGLTLSLRSHLVYPEPLGVPPEHDPDEVCIVVPNTSHAEVVELGGRPDFPEFEPIGVGAGEPFWFLSQNNLGPVEPFLGLSTDGVPNAAFSGALRFEFHPLEPATAGEFSLYQSGFPPRFFVSTRSPERTQSGEPVVELGPGMHDHYNWTFSKPGRYDLRVVASGQLIGAGEVSTEQIYKFLVEEP